MNRLEVFVFDEGENFSDQLEEALNIVKDDNEIEKLINAGAKFNRNAPPKNFDKQLNDGVEWSQHPLGKMKMAFYLAQHGSNASLVPIHVITRDHAQTHELEKINKAIKDKIV